jgi:hypothetical protein
VPYCDAVFTDREARNALVAHEDEVQVFDTFMPRRPEDLTEWLSSRPAP